MDKEIRVDFTDGRLFSKNQQLKGLDSLFWKVAKLDFPWTLNMLKEVKSDSDLVGEDENTLFFTGTNSQIKYKWEYSQMAKGEMCECCGSVINRLPWSYSRYPFLCSVCSSRMNEYGCDMFGMPKKKELPDEHWWLIV